MPYLYPIDAFSGKITEAENLISESSILKRLRMVKGERSYRSFGQSIGVNHETIRRYLLSGKVPATVVAKIAITYNVDCGWLLTGKSSSRVGASIERFAPEIHTTVTNRYRETREAKAYEAIHPNRT